MALPPGCNNNDVSPFPYRGRHLDQVESGMCEGCMGGFEVGELAAIREIDPDLRWCEACRARCLSCGHIKGVHAIVFGSGKLAYGCDGNHGEPGECACLGFMAEVPRAVVAAAKGIWISKSYQRQLEKEAVNG